MFKYLKKDFATSLTAVSFVVVAVTGVFLYFHFLNVYVKNMHEILGLIFVVGAMLHIFYNFKPMSKYFSKNIFRALSVVLVVLSLFLLNLNGSKKSSFAKLNKVFTTAPMSQTAQVLGINKEKLQAKLKLLNADENASLKEISAKNGKKSQEIIQILFQE